MAVITDISIAEAIGLGATAGAAAAGTIVWYLLRKIITGHEERFVSKDECKALQRLSTERNDNIQRLFERLDSKIDDSIEANEKQHELILEVLRSRMK